MKSWELKQKRFRDIFEEIELIMKQIPPENYSKFPTCHDPINERWELLHVIVSGAHGWQVVRQPNGNYLWDHAGDLSDVAVQFYANGWIVRAFSATDILGVYDPESIKRVKCCTDYLHEIEQADLEYYESLLLKYLESGTNQKFIEIINNAFDIARNQCTYAVDQLQLAAARKDVNDWEIMEELEEFSEQK